MSLFNINEDAMRDMMRQAIEEKAAQLAQEKIFWTVSELEEYANMNINTMKNHFFYDERFPKFKVGRDWRFPVARTKQFLEQWAMEQQEQQRLVYV